MESSPDTSKHKYAGASLAVLLLGGIVALVFIGELPRVLFHDTTHSAEDEAQQKATIEASAPPASPAATPPIAAPLPAAAPDLKTRLNAELPSAGLPATARIIETRVNGDRLTLIFDPALRSSLGNLSALDGWIGALSSRAEKLGYSHLELRIRLRDAQGQASDLPIDSLVRTPPEKQPRPEPLDDGVRR